MNYHISFDLELKRNPYKGLFFALEGIDGSGKSLQVERLKKNLEYRGRAVITKHPFEGELGKFIRTILAGEKRVPPVALQYLISANRKIQQDEITTALQNGQDVLIDRYVWSAVAYGILDHPEMDRKNASSWLLIGQSILSMYHQFLMPNTTFFLTIAAETAVKRLDKMDKKKEIYENSEKIRKIDEVYKWLINKFPNEFTVIDAEQSVDDVAKDILKSVEKLL